MYCNIFLHMAHVDIWKAWHAIGNQQNGLFYKYNQPCRLYKFFFFCPLLAIIVSKTHISMPAGANQREHWNWNHYIVCFTCLAQLKCLWAFKWGFSHHSGHKNHSADSFCILSQWALCSSCFLQLGRYCLNEILHKVWLWHFHQELRFKYLNIHGKVYLLVAVTACYFFKHIFMWFISKCRAVFSVPVAQWLEHCISSAKGCGFNSQGTHILTKNV